MSDEHSSVTVQPLTTPQVKGRKYERDIDVLLAEEFAISPEFADWFLQQTQKFKYVEAQVTDIYISMSDNLGESDLVVKFQRSDRKSFALFIEDKIDAQFQPNQLERYRQRAQLGVEKGQYTEFEVVLCAPNIYRNAHLDAVKSYPFVSYEAICAFLRSCDPNDPRLAYRADFIESSIPSSVSAWKRNDDEVTNRFWDAAYKIAHSEFPELEMKPLKVTKNSTWINFRTWDMPTMPQRIYISFKGDRGQMDLTFTNTRDYLILPHLKPVLTEKMDVVQTGKSAAIRLCVDGFKVAVPDIDVLGKVRDAFAACVQLLKFYRENIDLLKSAASEACPISPIPRSADS